MDHGKIYRDEINSKIRRWRDEENRKKLDGDVRWRSDTIQWVCLRLSNCTNHSFERPKDWVGEESVNDFHWDR